MSTIIDTQAAPGWRVTSLQDGFIPQAHGPNRKVKHFTGAGPATACRWTWQNWALDVLSAAGTVTLRDPDVGDDIHLDLDGAVSESQMYRHGPLEHGLHCWEVELRNEQGHVRRVYDADALRALVRVALDWLKSASSDPTERPAPAWVVEDHGFVALAWVPLRNTCIRFPARAAACRYSWERWALDVLGPATWSHRGAGTPYCAWDTLPGKGQHASGADPVDVLVLSALLSLEHRV